MERKFTKPALLVKLQNRDRVNFALKKRLEGETKISPLAYDMLTEKVKELSSLIYNNLIELRTLKGPDVSDKLYFQTIENIVYFDEKVVEVEKMITDNIVG